MRNSLIILAILIFNTFLAFSQSTKSNKYVIITCKIDKNKDNHPYEEYSWIIPLDSIQGKNSFKIYPLYLDEFSENNISECLKKDDINIFTMYDNDNFIVDNKGGMELMKIIDKNKQKFFNVVKKWNKGYKENVKLFLTPVIGEFCNSTIAVKDSKRIGYKGVIYIPISNFEYYKDFNKSEFYSEIIFSDFSNTNFINK